jgi:hypothetical protein
LGAFGRRWAALCLAMIVPGVAGAEPGAAEPGALAIFRTDIEPMLDQFCYDCHGYGSNKGGVVLDGFESDRDLRDHSLWLRALKNVRGGLMPPADQPQLPEAERTRLLSWIKGDIFATNPAEPDPGRVTLRRLNRVEYRNTVRELLGVDFNTETEFPADDTGHGFDNLADVLTISPLLLEKYLDAAQTIIAQSVPTRPLAVAEHRIRGRQFQSTIAVDQVVQTALDSAGVPAAAGKPMPQAGTVQGNALDLLYYAPATVAASYEAKHAGPYQVVVDLQTIERYADDLFDYNSCQVRIRIDGEVVFEQPFVREGYKMYSYTFDREWAPGRHEVVVELEPLIHDQPQHRRLRIRLAGATVRGPLPSEFWVPPPRYAEFFPAPVPGEPAARREYARERLKAFATRAFRQRVDRATVDRLVRLAEHHAAEPGSTFEAGVAQAMVAVLASPRFLFRDEGIERVPGERYPRIDEYALASRLSYFLWSSMPDAELFRLAREGRLRRELGAQVERMLADPRAQELVRNFTGQWLQARDVTTVPIESFDVYLRDHPHPEVEEARRTFRRIGRIDEAARTPEQKAEAARARALFQAFNRQPRPQLTSELREAMQRETELLFEHVLKQNRSVIEFLVADYVHVNERLARHYGLEGVEGDEMRLVKLPPDSPRGGVLTQGTVLAVTSNPTRTSAVKRGVFILDHILGAPPPPPPPGVPTLEEATRADGGGELSLREALDQHASNSLCRSCHNRMDPLGFALENFNAMGAWRDSELNRPIESKGRLVSGRTFSDVRELKQILATDHRQDFFYCLAEKLLTYALGRGMDYYDTETLDRLVQQLEAADGRLSALIVGIVESTPFQKRRPLEGDIAGATARGSAPTAALTP